MKYTSAALAFLLGASSAPSTIFSTAFTAHQTSIASGSRKQIITNPNQYTDSRRYTAIPYDDRSSYSSTEQQPLFDAEDLQQQGLSLLDSIGTTEDDEAEVDALLARKEERRAARLRRVRRPNYQITLPIGGASLLQPPPTLSNTNNNDAAIGEGSNNGEGAEEALASLVAKGQEIAVANTIGMSLRQVYIGRKLSELALDVDTLRFQSFVDELQGRRVDGEEVEEDAGDSSSSATVGSVKVLQNSALETLTESFDGVVVSSVTIGGLAWKSGVRAGDVLTATSATLGSKLWPKSTLDGVRSAISSRKAVIPTMDFEFRRLLVDGGEANVGGAGVEAVRTFELSMSRPIGINVEGEAWIVV